MVKTWLALTLALLGCADDVSIYWRPSCLASSAERRATFIIDCAAAANPRSDEEGEDLVIQCERTAESLFCPDLPIACTSHSCVPCAEVRDAARVAECREWIGSPDAGGGK